MASHASLARHTQACSDVTWSRNWSAFGETDQRQLIAGGLGTQVSWAYAFEDEPDEEVPAAVHAYVEGLCGPREVVGGGTWED